MLARMLERLAGLGEVKHGPLQLSGLNFPEGMDKMGCMTLMSQGHTWPCQAPFYSGTKYPSYSWQDCGSMSSPLPSTATLPCWSPCRLAVLPGTNIPSLPVTVNIVAGQTVNQPPLFECCWQPQLVQLLFNDPPVVYPGGTH